MKGKDKGKKDGSLPTGAPFRVPWHPEVSARRMREAAEIWADRDAAEAQARLERQRAFAEGLERGRAALRDLVGGENAFDLWRLKRELRREAILATRPPHGLDRADMRRRHKKRVKAFLGDRKLDHRTVERAAHLIFEEVPRWHHTVWDGLVSVKDLPGGTPIPDDPRRNPWVTFTPPFGGWQSGLSGGLTTSAFSTNRTALLDANAGLVGNILSLECGDASDFDCGSLTADTQVAFWYQAPVTGLIEVIIAATCGDAHHELSVEDEWGVSDASVTQRNLFMAHVIHPNVLGPSFALASELHYDDDTSTWRDERHIQPGQHVEAPRLVSSGPVAAGEWVVIRAGCRSEDGAITNDMEIHSRSTFSWFLARIHVHVVE